MRRAQLSDNERLAWLRLARSESVGPATFAYLIDRFETPNQALEALPELARRGGRARLPRIADESQIAAELEAGAKLGARLIAACEPGYPIGLGVLDTPPPAIWVLGETELLKRNMVAIVGARIASSGGRRLARELAASLGEAGWVVVSGMARGIDSAAHEAALATGSVAVLAGGVDNVYPPENERLHAALGKQGAIVSERPIGAGVKAADFPRRNRIISGLSRGVIVVEAELRSGSLITARLAGEQGREVFAVPGSPLDPRARGCNDLLRQGATLVEDASDVIRVLEAMRDLSDAEGDSAPLKQGSESPQDFGEIHDLLEGLLSPAPTSIDSLAREAALPASHVLAALTELALAGRVEILPGNLVVRL